MFFTLAIAFMTAFYMWRLCFLTFFGKPRNQERFEHAHESPRWMTWPLVFLAFLSIFAGWVALPWLHHGYSSFVYYGEVHHAGPNYMLMVISTIVAVSGIGLAYLIYYRQTISADRLAERFRPIYTLLYNKYYFDEFYDLILIRPIMAFARFMWTFDAGVIDGLVNLTGRATILWSDIKEWFDTWIVDGAVNGVGWLVRQGSALLRFMEPGKVQFYALFVLAGVVMAALAKYERAFIVTRWPLLSGVFLIGLVVLGVLTRYDAVKQRKAQTVTGMVEIDTEEQKK